MKAKNQKVQALVQTALIAAMYAALTYAQNFLLPGFIKAMWCGDRACEDALKEQAGITSRCIPFEQEAVADVCPVCGKKAHKMLYWGKAY